MADIAHTIPTSVAYLDGSEFGLIRPGIQVTPFASGRFLTRNWSDHNVAEYDLMPALFNSTDDTLEEWEAFWHQIEGGAAAGYIVDPISGTHRDLICGGIADGTQTTFPIPVLSPTDITPFADGRPRLTALSTHTAANLYGADTDVNCNSIDDTHPANATEANALGVSLDGLGSVMVTPDGGANPGIRPLNEVENLSAAQEYTAIVAVKLAAAAAQNYRCYIQWLESDESAISASNGSDVAVAGADGWVVLSVTATSPALTNKARVFAERNDASGTDKFFVDCFALNPGDYTRWHLPSVSPGLIEFNNPPSSGVRITATATGQRVTRCRFEPGTRWSMRSPGHASVRSIRATEWVEF